MDTDLKRIRPFLRIFSNRRGARLSELVLELLDENLLTLLPIRFIHGGLERPSQYAHPLRSSQQRRDSERVR